ncbi:MAG: glycosyltransferase family 2 protein [Candidatus Nomurabacteria bacterium]|nr:MAG: glycosyltransferase family 2 protein [Candidatus Nomurabacteria bacterium]
MQNPETPELSIHIVTWNSGIFIQHCLESLKKQSYQNFRVLIIDNNSTDDTLAILSANYPQIQVIKNRTNLGFAKAHNQGIHFSSSPFVLVLNPDIIATSTFLETLMHGIQSKPKCGSIGGKTLRFAFAEGDLKQVDMSDRIDSVGLQGLRSRRVVDRGEGQRDRGQFDAPTPVFGISGSAVVYRRQALEDVRYQDEYFDEEFFAYKEDVDMAWRLQRLGWEAWCIPQALAYHHRSARGDSESTRQVVAEHRHRAKVINALSYRNHLLMLAKNESIASFLLSAPWILSYELKKFIYLLFFQPSVLRQSIAALKLMPLMRKKKKALMHKARVSQQSLRKWFQ